MASIYDKASIVKAQKENDDDMLSDLDKEVRDINDIEISVRRPPSS